MSPIIQQSILPQVISSISLPRLSSYRRFFATNVDTEIYGLYCWNEEVSLCFFRTLGLTEIAIRNQFHSVLSQHYGVAGTAASKDWYNHIQLSQLSMAAIQKITHYKRHRTLVPKNPTPSPDDVVSKLTFGFWPHLLDVARDFGGGPVNWDILLPQILPGHRQKHPTYWRRTAAQDELFARIDLCNGLRNRIAHHEPLWKAGQLMEETRARRNRTLSVVAPSPTTIQEALDRLTLMHSRTMELLHWLSPPLATTHRSSPAYLTFQKLATQNSVNAFKALRKTQKVDLGQFRSLRKMKQAFKKISKPGQVAEVSHKGAVLGHWLSPP